VTVTAPPPRPPTPPVVDGDRRPDTHRPADPSVRPGVRGPSEVALGAILFVSVPALECVLTFYCLGHYFNHPSYSSETAKALPTFWNTPGHPNLADGLPECLHRLSSDSVGPLEEISQHVVDYIKHEIERAQNSRLCSFSHPYVF